MLARCAGLPHLLMWIPANHSGGQAPRR